MDNTENAIRSESVTYQNTVKVDTDGSKLGGKLGRVFVQIPKQLPKTSIFPPWIYSTVFQAEVLAISEVAESAFGKNAQSKYCCAGG